MNSVPETLADIEAIPSDVLTCKQIAKVVKTDPYALHEQAIYEPDRLGFPVIVCGKRVKIPKQPFLKFMKG